VFEGSVKTAYSRVKRLSSWEMGCQQRTRLF
jgi:hypothetical protein